MDKALVQKRDYDEECWKEKYQPNREHLAAMVEQGGRFLYFRESPYSASEKELLFHVHISKLITDECNSSKYQGRSGGATPAGQRYILSKAKAILPRFANGIGGIEWRSKLLTLSANVYFTVFPQIFYDLGYFDTKTNPDELLYDHKNSFNMGYLIFTSCTCDLCLMQRSQ